MKRKLSFIAACAGIFLVVGMGLGARLDPSADPDGSICSPDIDRAFEMCQRGQKNCPCEHVTEEFAAACQAGCVMSHCPGQVSCNATETIWCAACSDMQGALFWNNLDSAADRCNYKFQWPQAKIDWQAWSQCRVADVEQHCPALIGTDWRQRLLRAHE